MRVRTALALGALLLAPVVACSDDELGAGEARLEVDGVATVERADGDDESIDSGTDLRRGDRVSMERGTAVMRLRGGTELELRVARASADGQPAGSRVLMDDRPVLEAGDVLVTTPGSFGLEADGTRVEVSDGAARVTRALGMGVAAYDADVTLDSAGVTAEVPALREMAVPDLGRPPQSPRPISYDAQDTWDLRFLGAAMALDDRLSDLATGLNRTLPEGEGRTVGFFRPLLAGLDGEPQFTDALLVEHRDSLPGDTLIGTAIAHLGDRESFADRWQAVFDFRGDGADWGIVALDQDVSSDPLLDSIGAAIDSFASATEFALPPEPTETGADPAPTVPDPGSGDPGPSGGGGGPSPPPSTAPPPATTTPPRVTPLPEPPPELAPVVDPVTELLDDLVGGLLGGLLGG